MLFGAVAALIAVPFWLLFIFSGSLLMLLLANLVLLALSLVWLGPAAADVHDIAGPELRGSASSVSARLPRRRPQSMARLSLSVVVGVALRGRPFLMCEFTGRGGHGGPPLQRCN